MPRRFLIVCGLFVASIGCLGVSVGAARAAGPPVKAVVFDGATAASATFLVSLSGGSLVVDQGPGGFTCPGASHVAQSGLVDIGDGVSLVVPSSSGLGVALGPALTSQPNLTPEGVEALADDCDIVAQYAVVSGYLQQAHATAQSLAAAVDGCLSQVEATYCDIVDAVEAAIVDPMITSFLIGTVDQYPAATGLGGMKAGVGCFEFLPFVRTEPPYLLDDAEFVLATCQDAHTNLLGHLATIGPVLSTQGEGLYLANAAAGLHVAQRARSVAETVELRLDGLATRMTLAAVQDSCDACPTFSGPIPHQSPTILTSLERGDGSVLQTLAAVFQQAAEDASEPDDAARWSAIAAQMQGTPPARVLQLTHPPAFGVGQHVVMLRSDALPDDPTLPLAVVMTSAHDANHGPYPSVLDRHIVHDVWRVAADVLGAHGGVVVEDDDVDDDGVRDGFEDGSGGYTSPTQTGTDPALADTDGDLYLDGTEVRAGSDPNSASSVPEHVGVALPALGALGAAILAVTAVLVGRNVARRRET